MFEHECDPLQVDVSLLATPDFTHVREEHIELWHYPRILFQLWRQSFGRFIGRFLRGWELGEFVQRYISVV